MYTFQHGTFVVVKIVACLCNCSLQFLSLQLRSHHVVEMSYLGRKTIELLEIDGVQNLMSSGFEDSLQQCECHS